MLQSEFEKRTGFEPTATEYAVIQGMYSGFNGSQEQLCRDFKENGGARKLREEMSAHVEFMQNRLDKWVADQREEERKQYESEHGVKQANYAELANGITDGNAHYVIDAKLVEEMSARVKALENENDKLKQTIALIVRICE